jgi:hypothetical protein
VSTTNGPNTATRAALARARPVVLLRYRPGVVGERGRMVHMMPLPGGGQMGVALCGALLRPDLVEMVTPGHGAPCTLCLVNHVSADPPLADTSASIPPADAHSDVRPLQAAVGYRAWGWPVTLRGKHVWLTLEPDTAALMIPVPLVTQMSTILRQRHCPPLVLSHPEVPGHRVVLAGNPTTWVCPGHRWCSGSEECSPCRPP